MSFFPSVGSWAAASFTKSKLACRSGPRLAYSRSQRRSPQRRQGYSTQTKASSDRNALPTDKEARGTVPCVRGRNSLLGWPTLLLRGCRRETPALAGSEAGTDAASGSPAVRATLGAPRYSQRAPRSSHAARWHRPTNHRPPQRIAARPRPKTKKGGTRPPFPYSEFDSPSARQPHHT